MFILQIQDIRKKHLFDILRGCEARNEVLRTKTSRVKYLEIDKWSIDGESETLGHVLNYTGLPPALPDEVTNFEWALGFAGEDRITDDQRITIIKRKLEDWSRMAWEPRKYTESVE